MYYSLNVWRRVVCLFVGFVVNLFYLFICLFISFFCYLYLKAILSVRPELDATYSGQEHANVES